MNSLLLPSRSADIGIQIMLERVSDQAGYAYDGMLPYQLEGNSQR